MSNDSNNQDNGISLGHRAKVLLEGLAHGAWVELPTSLASIVDFGSRTVNKIPKLWGGDNLVSEPLQYKEGVRSGAQKAYDKINEWSGYEPPELLDSYDTILYGTSELAGELVLPAGAYTKWGGLITKAPTLSGMAAVGLSGIKSVAGKLFKHGKLPTALVGADVLFNDGDITGALVDKAADIAADQMEKINDAPDTGGEPVRKVRPESAEKEKRPSGPRETEDPKIGDNYNSWIDGLESIIGLDVPDNIERYADGGLSAIANSKFADWMGAGSFASKLLVGLPALFASNFILDKFLGNGLMSGIISLGLAIVAAHTLPKMFNDAAASKVTEEAFSNDKELPKSADQDAANITTKDAFKETASDVITEQPKAAKVTNQEAQEEVTKARIPLAGLAMSS
jgi:hypothetical protein